MRLTDSTELRQHVFDKNHVNTTMPVVKDVIISIQDWLEEHGFHICPVKKEKGTVAVKEVEEEINVGDEVVVTLRMQPWYGEVGKVNMVMDGKYEILFNYPIEKHVFHKSCVRKVDEVEVLPWNDKSIDTMVKLRECALQTLQDPKYCLPLTAYIDLLNVKSIKEGRMLLSSVYMSEKAKRKDLQDCQERVMKNIKDMFEEPKPSADGEEEMPDGWKYMGKGHKVIERGEEKTQYYNYPTGSIPWDKIMHQGADGKDIREKAVSYIPFQRCPVCEGNGTRFDTAPFSNPMNTVMCHCCQGSGCIPMKREVK